MTTTVKIDMSNPLALPLVNYLEKLPFVTVERQSCTPKSQWQQALDEGAIPADEFFDELRRQVNEHYDKM